mgnify:CR=1 FL=1
MRWLNVAEVAALHVRIMEEMGWSPAPLRDEGGLESAVMRPQMAAQYEDADLVRQAAMLAVGISQAQAFVDGNKRTAYASLELFLHIDGVRLTVDPLQIARALERVAEAGNRREGEEGFAAWLRAAIEKSA